MLDIESANNEKATFQFFMVKKKKQEDCLKTAFSNPPKFTARLLRYKY